MANRDIERRFRFTWAWIAALIVVLGVGGWIVYSFFGVAQEPYPVDVQEERSGGVQTP